MPHDELYKKHRPKTLEDVLGQEKVLPSLQRMIKNNSVPHTILFSGPSGCGKTTLARILAKKLGCSKHDLAEVNSADFRGIDKIREISARIGLAPMAGKTRVWIIDEVHKSTNDAQNAMLKILEDTPKHVYFFLCTTEPQKLLKAIHTRCSEIAVKSLDEETLFKLIKDTAKKEKVDISKKVIKKITETCEGSPRKAMVFLHQVIGMTNEKTMLETIQPSSIQSASIKIARALIDKRTKWPEMSKILKECDIKEAEGIRYLVLSYAQSVLLGGAYATGRAYSVIAEFRDNFYDCKSAGLVASCYQIITGN